MKYLLSCLITLLLCNEAESQVICIICKEQIEPLNTTAPNLIVNGSFEINTCDPGVYHGGMYCPNSMYYDCDVSSWTCTGGGSKTYAEIVNSSFPTLLPDGDVGAYMGNAFPDICSDFTADCLTSDSCIYNNVDVAQITHDADFGGSIGVSLEQTVSGLTVDSIYIIEFWAGGEDESYYPHPGLFAVDIGFGKIFLSCHGTNASAGSRYIIEFRATAASHTIQFTNWGHICGNCTEVVIDDVKCYKLSDAVNRTDCEIVPDTLENHPIAVPQAFSPNADGKNDYFSIFSDSLSAYQLWIYNRWGETVYYSNNLNELNHLDRGWNGEYKGIVQDMGVYVYYINARTLSGKEIELKGNVTLLK